MVKKTIRCSEKYTPAERREMARQMFDGRFSNYLRPKRFEGNITSWVLWRERGKELALIADLLGRSTGTVTVGWSATSVRGYPLYSVIYRKGKE